MGELTVIVDGKETVAKRGDSVYIGPNEKPRDRQSQQRGLHHRRRRRAGEVMMVRRPINQSLRGADKVREPGIHNPGP